MNTIKLSAALTAAVLAGALSTVAYAADAERPASRITVSGGSIILKKAINLDKAPGAGGIKGTITFNVAAGQDGDLPQAHTADEMLGTADQLASTTATAEFTADAQGKANTESNVTVDFNMDKFTKPGIYYYRLTEQAHGISGLSTAPLYLLKVSVANESEVEPDGQHFKLEYAILAEKETGTKAELVTNEYTTHSLTVTKRLAGDFASYDDSFDFTLHITDPDTENHMASVTLRTGPADDELSGPGTVYTLENGEKEIKAETLIIATGATAKYLGLPSETKFRGQGVSACATCDGFFYRKKDVAVVGGGDTACEEATYLASLCRKVYLIVRKPHLRASKAMQQRVFNTPNIEVLFEHNTAEVLGDDSGVTGALLRRNDGSERKIDIAGFFLAIGHHPNTELFAEQLALDAEGYIKVEPGTSKTSVEGVFAAGDVKDPHYRQAITAAASGCVAALDCERFLLQ